MRSAKISSELMMGSDLRAVEGRAVGLEMRLKGDEDEGEKNWRADGEPAGHMDWVLKATKNLHYLGALLSTSEFTSTFEDVAKSADPTRASRQLPQRTTAQRL